jgi:hypothetical protein
VSAARIPRSRPGWSVGVATVAARAVTPIGIAALSRAAGYAATYGGDRATMLFDVVDSNQHGYSNRVLRNVARFRQQRPGLTIGELAVGGPQFTGLGLTVLAGKSSAAKRVRCWHTRRRTLL